MTDFLTAKTWETLDIEAVWHSLDQSFQWLDTPGQVQLAGRAIEHLVELFVASSEQVFEELDATLAKDGPQMSIEQFLPYVRQSMEIDFSQYVGGFERDAERGPYAPRIERPDALEAETIAAVMNAVAEAEEKEMALEDTAPFDLETALELAHAENVEGWTDAISAYFNRMGEPAISLKSLQQALGLPWIEVWLGLLLGGYGLERRGDDFCSGDIWVYDRVPVRKEPEC